MARVAKVEQQPAATGTTLVVMVGLGVAFLLFMAFLNVVKSGNLLNESNLLYAALIFYAGAGALYLGFGVTGTARLHQVRLARDLGGTAGQHRRGGASLVRSRDIRPSPASTKCCSASCGRWPRSP